jgi:hypothetical protein
MVMVLGLGNGVDRQASDRPERTLGRHVISGPERPQTAEFHDFVQRPTNCLCFYLTRAPLVSGGGDGSKEHGAEAAHQKAAGGAESLWGKGGQTEPLRLSSTHGSSPPMVGGVRPASPATPPAPEGVVSPRGFFPDAIVTGGLRIRRLLPWGGFRFPFSRRLCPKLCEGCTNQLL